MILASLLEYSPIQLKKKLIKIFSQKKRFLQLQNQSLNHKNNSIHLHLDFVLPKFASSRQVMESLSLFSVIEALKKCLEKENLFLSLHFMGEGDDFLAIIRDLQILEIPDNWSLIYFFPENLLPSFHFLPPQNLGIWLDKNEWEIIDFNTKKVDHFLLMTVFAGKSGQKLETKIQTLALKTAKQFPEKHFVLDGGWSIEQKVTSKNVDLVSYSSFWREFEQNQ